MPGRTYICMPSGNGTSNSVPSAAIRLDETTPNVEIRTQGKPIVGGNQAVLKFDSWSGYNGVMLRAIIAGFRLSNVTIGWLTIDGNKASCGVDYNARTTWIQTHLSFTLGNDGGLYNLVIYGGSGLRLYQIDSKNAITDALLITGDPTGSHVLLTNFRAEDCDFHHCRRQGLTVDRLYNSTANYDDIYFLRCKFRNIGDEASVMRGQLPGSPVDVEPLSGNEIVYGLTFDNCDLIDAPGCTMLGVNVISLDGGRGLSCGGSQTMKYFRVIGCRIARCFRMPLLLMTSDSTHLPSFHHVRFYDNTISDCGAEANGTNYFEFWARPNTGAVEVSTFVDMICSNNQFTIGGSASGGYYFNANIADTGNSINIYFGNYSATVTTNGATTIATHSGFPG